MSRSIPENRLTPILDVVRKASAACTPADVRAALNPAPPRRNLQRLLATLVRQHRLTRVGTAKATRYRIALPTDVFSDLAPATKPLEIRKGSASEAIYRLVSRPLGDRMPVRYHREWLDAYQPNNTFYLSFHIRDLLRNGPGVPAGAAKLKDPTFLAQFTERVAYTALCLEGMTVPRPVVTGFLQTTPPTKPTSRAMQWAWNQRTAVNFLADHIGACAVGAGALIKLADNLEDGLFAKNEFDEAVLPDALRRGPLMSLDLGGKVLPAPDSLSTYQPPDDPMQIRACFEQLANLAAEIEDPFEQAFFTFVHVLYLQPFTFNFSTACLAANLPLVRASLHPITFVTIPARDFRLAIAAWCELQQLDLLREVFLHAYFDGLALPKGHPYGPGA